MQPTKKRRKSPLMIIIPEELDDLLADLLPPVVSLHLQSEVSDLFLSSRTKKRSWETIPRIAGSIATKKEKEEN